MSTYPTETTAIPKFRQEDTRRIAQAGLWEKLALPRADQKQRAVAKTTIGRAGKSLSGRIVLTTIRFDSTVPVHEAV